MSHFKYISSPPSLSELTPIITNIELTHLGSDVFNYSMHSVGKPKNDRLLQIGLLIKNFI